MENNRRRLQFDFTEEALKELDELQEKTGLATRAELIRHALRFLQWGVEEAYNNNAALLIEKEGKLREVVFPFWKRPETASVGGSNSNNNHHRG